MLGSVAVVRAGPGRGAAFLEIDQQRRGLLEEQIALR